MKGIQNINRTRRDNGCENQSQPRGICLFRDPEYALLQQVCRTSLKSQRNQAKDTQRQVSATQHGNAKSYLKIHFLVVQHLPTGTCTTMLATCFANGRKTNTAEQVKLEYARATRESSPGEGVSIDQSCAFSQRRGCNSWNSQRHRA